MGDFDVEVSRRFQMLIENATAELHRARLRHQRELAERTRFRRLVEQVDEVIELCEETHLQGIKEAPRDLAQQSGELLQIAVGVVKGADDEVALRTVTDAMARRQVKVTEIMDVLWTVQEVVFDLMLPWRTELPEDVEVTPGVGLWRYNAA